MEAYSGIVKGLRGLRARSFELAPETTRSCQLGWEAGESADEMMDRIAKHGRVLQGDAEGSACVAEGKGLKFAVSGQLSTFVVRAFDNKGRQCAAGGHAIEVREAEEGKPDDEHGGRRPTLSWAS
eukprot:436231-Rhodomonas_salina.1